MPTVVRSTHADPHARRGKSLGLTLVLRATGLVYSSFVLLDSAPPLPGPDDPYASPKQGHQQAKASVVRVDQQADQGDGCG
jgi:hypothetical protein